MFEKVRLYFNSINLAWKGLIVSFMLFLIAIYPFIYISISLFIASIKIVKNLKNNVFRAIMGFSFTVMFSLRIILSLYNLLINTNNNIVINNFNLLMFNWCWNSLLILVPIFSIGYYIYDIGKSDNSSILYWTMSGFLNLSILFYWFHIFVIYQ